MMENFAISGWASKPGNVRARRVGRVTKVHKRDRYTLGPKEWGYNRFYVSGNVYDPELWTALDIFCLVDSGPYGGSVQYDRHTGEFTVMVRID